MKDQLRAACSVFFALAVVTGLAYPLLVTLVAQGVFPFRANGSVIERDGRRLGSELIGQPFVDSAYSAAFRKEAGADRYFWGRPSATSAFPYNASSSTGSNLGPTNPDHLTAVKERIDAIQQAHDKKETVPVDLVTASASGLDPHISPAAAEYQIERVARSRSLSVSRVRQLVAEHTEGRTLGILGEPRVNVLLLNLALDAAAP